MPSPAQQNNKQVAKNMSQEGNTLGPKFLGRSPTEWLLSLPIFALLLLTLVIGTGEYFHGQLLRMGESMFGDQAAGVQYFIPLLLLQSNLFVLLLVMG